MWNRCSSNIHPNSLSLSLSLSFDYMDYLATSNNIVAIAGGVVGGLCVVSIITFTIIVAMVVVALRKRGEY